MDRWFEIRNASDVPSPALLVYPARVAWNIDRAIQIAGAPHRLRPHVKTHKMAEVIRLHLARGVDRFKCATIAEAEMTAAAGGRDVLLAFPPVGPNIARLFTLRRRFPDTRFSVTADSIENIEALSRAASGEAESLEVYVDVDCGMSRTGVRAERAVELCGQIQRPLRLAGLHAYDGHVHDADLGRREARVQEAFAPVFALRRDLEAQGNPIALVLGGTPTFAWHARHPNVECSPGTYVFWDFGYADGLPDLPFELAAVLLTRVVSKPGAHRLCLDLGHKAVASENPHPRARFLDLPDATAVLHSEEHLVIETPRAEAFRVGDVLYAVPRHICPTVAWYSEATVVENGLATGRWDIVARGRRLTI